jgi:hypothetical protein
MGYAMNKTRKEVRNEISNKWKIYNLFIKYLKWKITKDNLKEELCKLEDWKFKTFFEYVFADENNNNNTQQEVDNEPSEWPNAKVFLQ